MYKKIVVMLLILISVNFVYGTNYYFATNGSDAGAGTQASPYQTIGKHNSISVSGGDMLLFQCGQLWNIANDTGSLGTGTTVKDGAAGSPVTYQAYGNCIKDTNGYVVNKPRFVNANITSASSCFSNLTTGNANIWNYTCGKFPRQATVVFNISWNYTVNKGTVFGIYNWSTSQLAQQAQFFANETTPYEMWIYSIGNPITLYGNVMFVNRQSIIYDWDIHDTNFYNLSLEWSAYHGIALEQQVKNIKISDLDTSYIGGGYFRRIPDERVGNGFQLFKNSSNVEITRNRCWETYDACYTNQGNSGTDFQQVNITYSYNLAWNSSYCYEFFQSDSGARAWNMSYHHNTCVGAGQGWYYPTRSNSINGRCIRVGQSYNVSDLKIYDNLCMEFEEYATGTAQYITNISGKQVQNTSGTNVTWWSDYNLWFKNTTSPYIIGTSLIGWYYPRTSLKTYANVDLFAADLKRETNSRNQSTEFNDLEARDLRPLMGSLACSMSSTGSYVGALPCFGTGTVATNQYYIELTDTSQLGVYNMTFAWANITSGVSNSSRPYISFNITALTTCSCSTGNCLFSLTDNCILLSSLALGNITFQNTGNWTCNATISANVSWLTGTNRNYLIGKSCRLSGKMR